VTDVRKKYLGRESRACPTCPGGMQMDPTAARCPSCGEFYLPKKPHHVRIRTLSFGEDHRRLPMGQDTIVEVVFEDGSYEPIPNVVGAQWSVSARTGECQAILVVRNLEIDVEASADVFEATERDAVEMARLLGQFMSDAERERNRARALEREVENLVRCAAEADEAHAAEVAELQRQLKEAI